MRGNILLVTTDGGAMIEVDFRGVLTADKRVCLADGDCENCVDHDRCNGILESEENETEDDES